MKRPCLDCGEPADHARCPDHTRPSTSRPSRPRGYDTHWDTLSRRARKTQPWCTDCGTTTDLQTDHTPEAWARKAAGKSIRLVDVDVVCGPCNRARGAARVGLTTRGDTPSKGRREPSGQAQGRSHTAGGAR